MKDRIDWRLRKLRRRADFQLVYRKGEKRNGKIVNLFSLRRTEETLRVGITVTRKSGGAVERNRLRRQLRHLLAARLVFLEGHPVDLVFHVRPGVGRAKPDELEGEVTRLLGSLEKGLRRNPVRRDSSDRRPGRDGEETIPSTETGREG